MVLTTRLTHNFAEVKVDEIETTLWKSILLQIQKNRF